jgi:hypothetical protein
MNVRVLAEAEVEIQEATIWYEERRQGLGEDFLAEVRNDGAGLARLPGYWQHRGNGS